MARCHSPFFNKAFCLAEACAVKMFYRTLLFLHLAVCLGFSQTGPTDSTAIFFISDCQRPFFIEKMLQGEYNNKEGTDSLFSDIIRQHPKCLFILGDITRAGSSSNNWRPVNSFLFALRNEDCRVYATPGNHEYMMHAQKGVENFSKSFNQRQLLGYCLKRGTTAIVILNSNFSQLSSEDFAWQQRWFLAKMDSLDEDASVKAIIAGTHYPPYTNSSVVHSDTKVQRYFVPRFEQSRKAKLFLAGHSHNLEYFNGGNGKKYMVIGGGGGIAQSLDEKRLFIDQIPQAAKPRFFYVIITAKDETLNIEIRGRDKNLNASAAMRYSIP
jgi:hypothetical protein